MDHASYADLSTLVLVILYYLGHALHEIRHLLRLGAAKLAEAVAARRWQSVVLTIGRSLLILCIQFGPFLFYCVHLGALCFPER
jgi:hypothetical protein